MVVVVQAIMLLLLWTIAGAVAWTVFMAAGIRFESTARRARSTRLDPIASPRRVVLDRERGPAPNLRPARRRTSIAASARPDWVKILRN